MAPTMKDLEKENAKLREMVAGLEKRVTELQAQSVVSRPSKSREQAEAVRQILQKDGKISKEQLAAINPKYPSDPVYYAKNLLKIQIMRADGLYWTPEALAQHQAAKAQQTAPAQSQVAG